MTEELKHAVAISSLLQLPSEQIFRLCALARISKSCGLIFAAIRKTRPVSASPVQKAWIEKDVPQCGRAHPLLPADRGSEEAQTRHLAALVGPDRVASSTPRKTSHPEVRGLEAAPKESPDEMRTSSVVLPTPKPLCASLILSPWT
jgi:hypothetical protein